jgi:hypothetical protein
MRKSQHCAAARLRRAEIQRMDGRNRAQADA